MLSDESNDLIENIITIINDSKIKIIKNTNKTNRLIERLMTEIAYII